MVSVIAERESAWTGDDWEAREELQHAIRVLDDDWATAEEKVAEIRRAEETRRWELVWTIRPLIADPQPEVRGAAIETLLRVFRAVDLVPAAWEMLRHDSDARVRAAVARALAAMSRSIDVATDENARELRRAGEQDTDPDVREVCATELRTLGESYRPT